MTDRDRRPILAEWCRSGLSAAEFAPRAGVSPWTLYAWRRKLERAAVSSSDGTRGFVELVAAPASTHAGTIAIELPRGIVLHIQPDFDAASLRRAVDALLA